MYCPKSIIIPNGLLVYHNSLMSDFELSYFSEA